LVGRTMSSKSKLLEDMRRAQLVRLIAGRILEALAEEPLTLAALKKKVLSDIPQRGKYMLFNNVLRALMYAGIVEEEMMLCGSRFVPVYALNEKELQKRWWLRAGEL